MRKAPKSRSIFGIRIRAHYTCVIVFVLITASVSTQFPESYPLWQTLILGITTALVFFTSLSINELVFSLAVTRRQISVKDVILFAFGGVSQTIQENTSPTHELLTAVARFLSNLTATAIFYGIYATLMNYGKFAFAGVAQWLVFIWFMVFLLHFVPGFPLNGGIVLRALLWKLSGDYYRATRIACLTGQGIGLLMMFSGVLASIVTRQWLPVMIVTVAGWSLQSAAAPIGRQVVIMRALQHTSVRNLMTREYTVIEPGMTIGQLVREHILISGWRHFVVVDGNKLQGILSVRNMKAVPRRRWNGTPVGDVLTPSSEIGSAYPQQSGAKALEQMDELRTDAIPVLEDGDIVGILSREALVRLGKIRAEFGM